ncbi:MAG: DUF4292 domain-containing protein [Prevotella sp.]
MRISLVAKLALLVLPLMMGACKSSKSLQKDVVTAPVSTTTGQERLEKLNQNKLSQQFLTSKIKFKAVMGNHDVALTGNLKMKRNDVIRLQLMAFGFVEAARLEFTPEYVLIVDRMNKQYLKVPYNYIDFLRNSGINFYTLQALFWNELFVPGEKGIENGQLGQYSTSTVDDQLVVALEREPMSYKWLADKDASHIKMANILYTDKYRGNSQLNWDYQNFETSNGLAFPMKQIVRLLLPKTTVEITLTLNYLGKDEDWETRTTLSDKYRQVMLDDLMRRILSM